MEGFEELVCYLIQNAEDFDADRIETDVKSTGCAKCDQPRDRRISKIGQFDAASAVGILSFGQDGDETDALVFLLLTPERGLQKFPVVTRKRGFRLFWGACKR